MDIGLFKILLAGDDGFDGVTVRLRVVRRIGAPVGGLGSAILLLGNNGLLEVMPLLFDDGGDGTVGFKEVTLDEDNDDLVDEALLENVPVID